MSFFVGVKHVCHQWAMQDLTWTCVWHIDTSPKWVSVIHIFQWIKEMSPKTTTRVWSRISIIDIYVKLSHSRIYLLHRYHNAHWLTSRLNSKMQYRCMYVQIRVPKCSKMNKIKWSPIAVGCKTWISRGGLCFGCIYHALQGHETFEESFSFFNYVWKYRNKMILWILINRIFWIILFYF